ncbi:lactoylglutathione lyase [Hyphomonas adhaerens MHS-3]|uniref:Lactoylglutathione lyase n=2 Tax=Hyphomonas adhaerens TaxID=81029 RepID=A0A069E2V4_9PROT|nr:lactoylglutathione lyase [Hyphomonas adhaerens MHS-3]
MKYRSWIAGALMGAGLMGAASAQEIGSPDGAPSGVEGVGAVVIRVSDLKKAEEFYQSVLGVVQVRHMDVEAYSETIFAFPGGEGAKLVLVESHTPETPMSQARIVFNASAAETAVSRAVENGAALVRDAKPVPGTGGLVIGIVQDPDANTLEFIQRNEG